MPQHPAAPADVPRLAWALVADSDCPPERSGVGHGPLVREPLVVYGDGLRKAGAGEAGASYRLASLSSYAPLRPAQRPPAYCPVCRERVWMKLGPRRRYHYAHASESSTCVAITAEGALHLAAKLHLAAVLEEPRPLRIARLCHRAPDDLATPCHRTEVTEWMEEGWDEVRLEHAIPAIRADLMLLRQGQPLAAIEVRASHAVDEAKARRYRDLGIPWIEVPAARITDLWRPLWSGEGPLPVLADSASDGWRCPRHRSLFAAWTDHHRNGVHRLVGRYVHLYRTDGGISAGVLRAERIPLAVHERREDGRCVEAWLVREDTDSVIGHPVRTSNREAAVRTLHGAFAAWARWTREERGALVDSPMRWSPASVLPERVQDASFPQRGRWDPHTAAFILPPNAPPVSWPVAAADPCLEGITGSPECFWNALPERDRTATTHALVGRIWATLQVVEWTEGEDRRSRGMLFLHRHDGAVWAAWGSAPYLLEDDPGADWEQLFPDLVRALDPEAPEPDVEGALLTLQVVAATDDRERH